MSKTPNITNPQKAKIHIAKQQLGLSQENYEDILSNFNNASGKPCTSSKELSQRQAEVLIGILKKLGFKERRSYKNSKYSAYTGREARFATVSQLELIDSKWYSSENVHEKNDDAMNKYIKRIAGVDHISFLLKRDVSKVIKAIESIKEG